MKFLDHIGALWRRLLLRGTAFTGAYGKIRMLYAMEDPWQMTSTREQHRFTRTLAHLRGLSPAYGNILEFGCGEGHQSAHLVALCQALHGVDISAAAVARARRRCPQACFEVAALEDAQSVFADQHFDLITACEVLYYASDIKHILSLLQMRADRLYVSNYKPRSEKMRSHFSGPGWRPLDDIAFEDTVWECFVWENPAPR
jgi:SAM-dependent methyltransferase